MNKDQTIERAHEIHAQNPTWTWLRCLNEARLEQAQAEPQVGAVKCVCPHCGGQIVVSVSGGG